MYQILKTSLFIGCLAFMIGCTKNKEVAKRPSDLVVGKITSEPVPLSVWNMVGPFSLPANYTEADSSFYLEDLSAYGLNESNFTAKEIEKISTTDLPRYKLEEPSGVLDFAGYMSSSDIAVDNLGNVYVYTIVASKVDQELVLASDGSHDYNIWLNGQLVAQQRNRLNSTKISDQFDKISLKSGQNVFFAKISRGSNKLSWKLIANLLPLELAKKIYRENYLSDFIIHPNPESKLEVYLGAYDTAAFQIRNTKGLMITEGRLDRTGPFVSLEEVPDDFYYMNLILEDDTLKEVFYKGDLDNRIDRLIKSNNMLWQSEVASLKTRITHIQNDTPGNNGIYETRYYYKDKVKYAHSLNEIIDLKKSDLPKSPYFHCYRTGNQMNSEDCAILYIPQSVETQSNLSMIFMLPFKMGETDLITSWYASNHVIRENEMKWADKYGFILVYPFLGGENYEQTKAEQSIQNLAESIAERYPRLKFNKQYLMGGCSAGQRALLMAVNNTDYFQGVAVNCPITLAGSSPDEVVIDKVCNLTNLPIFIRHQLNDIKTPLIHTSLLVTEGLKCDVSISKHIEWGYVELSQNQFEKGFQFLAEFN